MKHFDENSRHSFITGNVVRSVNAFRRETPRLARTK
jgi:hypothetical protein